jgi:hypothetical protein
MNSVKLFRNTMNRFVNLAIKQANRPCSSKDTSSSSKKTFSKNNQLLQFLEENFQVITTLSILLGGGYYLGSQHVHHIVELRSVKEKLVEKEEWHKIALANREKAADEREKTLKTVLALREKAADEREKTLKTVLAEKEKAQEKIYELEARIRELETK